MTTSHSAHTELSNTTRTPRCGQCWEGVRWEGLEKGDQLALLNAGVQISDICVCFGRADNNNNESNSSNKTNNNNNHNKNKDNRGGEERGGEGSGWGETTTININLTGNYLPHN